MHPDLLVPKALFTQAWAHSSLTSVTVLISFVTLSRIYS